MWRQPVSDPKLLTSRPPGTRSARLSRRSAGQGTAHSHLAGTPKPAAAGPPGMWARGAWAPALQGCVRCPSDKLDLLQNGFSVNSDSISVLSRRPKARRGGQGAQSAERRRLRLAAEGAPPARRCPRPAPARAPPRGSFTCGRGPARAAKATCPCPPWAAPARAAADPQVTRVGVRRGRGERAEGQDRVRSGGKPRGCGG